MFVSLENSNYFDDIRLDLMRIIIQMTKRDANVCKVVNYYSSLSILYRLIQFYSTLSSATLITFT